MIDVTFLSTKNDRLNGYGRSKQALIKYCKEFGLNLIEDDVHRKFGLCYAMPASIYQLKADYKVLYTMFESNKLPPRFVAPLPEADKILVPSKFCSEVFFKHGFDNEVVPLGYDSEIYKPYNRPERDLFVFLHYDSFTVRKGWHEVFKAFQKAFKKDEPVRIIFKTTESNKLIPPLHLYPQMKTIVADYDDYEMNALLKKSDCFVFPSRGEGLGIPPLEAMATGVPVIAPNKHGIAQYYNKKCMLKVKSQKIKAIYAHFKGEDCGRMVKCSISDLARKMRFAYDNQEKMKKMGQIASEYAAKNYTYRHTAKKLSEVFHDLANQQKG